MIGSGKMHRNCKIVAVRRAEVENVTTAGPDAGELVSGGGGGRGIGSSVGSSETVFCTKVTVL